MRTKQKVVIITTLIVFFFLMGSVGKVSALSIIDEVKLIRNSTEHIINFFAIILSTWAILNIFFGLSSYKKRKDFALMMIGWNIINLLIAIFMFYLNINYIPNLDDEGFSRSIFFIEKIVFFNLILDIGYIIFSKILQGKNSKRLQEFGRALFIQGIFLFILDLVLSMIFIFLNYAVLIS